MGVVDHEVPSQWRMNPLRGSLLPSSVVVVPAAQQSALVTQVTENR